MEVTAAAFAMLGNMNAGVACKALNFPLKAQVLGFAGRRFLVTWEKGHLSRLLINNK